MATAGSEEAKQLEQIKYTFDKAYKEMGKASEADSNLATEADSDTDLSVTKYSLSKKNTETESIREQIRNNLEILNKMEVVANITSDGFNGKTDKQILDEVVKEYKKIGMGVDRQGFGFISLEESLINNGLNYLNSEAEYAAFSAIPRVLKRGIDITNRENHKGRGYNTVTIAAPVTINGKKGIVGVVVKKTKGNRYKTHRIVMPDGTVFVFEKNKTEATTASMTNRKTGEGPAITPVLDNSISAEGTKNNTKYSPTDNQGRQLTKEQQEYFKDSKVRDENGNLLTVYHGSKNKFNEFTFDINWFSSSKEYSNNYGKEANLFNKVTKTEPKKSKVTFETHLNIKILIWPKMNLFLLKLNRRRLNPKAVLPTSVKLYAKGARLQGCFP